jgi:hypothetical protein
MLLWKPLTLLERRDSSMFGVAGVLLIAAGVFLVAKWIKDGND